MDKVLPLLTKNAATARDQQAVACREAASQVQQAQATLERLTQFRAELLQRAPGLHGSADAQALVDHQRFVVRLDEAVAMQKHEMKRREDRAAYQQQQLVEKQKRLMAFETLAKRRAAVREAKENKVAQQASDEFAARAFARMQEEQRA